MFRKIRRFGKKLFLVPEGQPTKFEFTLYEGVSGRGGSPLPVKEQFLLLPKSEEPEPEKPEMVSAAEPIEEPVTEEPKMDEAEYPKDEPSEEGVTLVDETKPSVVIEGEVHVEGEAEIRAEEPEVEAPQPEPEIVEKKEEEPLPLQEIKITFNPESPFYTTARKIELEGTVAGLEIDKGYYMSIERLLEGNGKEFVGEALLSEGERTAVALPVLLRFN